MKEHGMPIVWTCLLLLLAGCAGESKEPFDLDDLERFGSLPYLKATRDQQLADELARIIEDGGTPEQLTISDGEQSVGDVLKQLFPKDQLALVVTRSDELFPPREFRFDPAQLEQVIAFRQQNDRHRLEARRALKQARPHMGIRFVEGFSADTSVIDAVRLCVRLEAFHAAELLAEDNLDGAILAVDQMLALTQCLGAEKHLDVRLHAAYLRAEALAVMQAIVTHAKVTREHLLTLLQTVQAQLHHWADDAHAWIGERAIGLHSYELVREGALLILLTEEEVKDFEREGDLRILAKAARRNADRDQIYYLETMRQVIEACEKPPHARLELLNSITGELEERRGASDYPLVAGRLLLKELDAAHAIQARDRANWEAWAVALEVATGGGPGKTVNPLTGKPYIVTRENSLVIVSGIATGREADHLKVYVPDFSKP